MTENYKDNLAKFWVYLVYPAFLGCATGSVANWLTPKNMKGSYVHKALVATFVVIGGVAEFGHASSVLRDRQNTEKLDLNSGLNRISI